MIYQVTETWQYEIRFKVEAPNAKVAKSRLYRLLAANELGDKLVKVTARRVK